MMLTLLLPLTLLAHFPLSSALDFNWCTKTPPGFRKCGELQQEYQSAGSVDFSCSHDLAEGGCLQEVNEEPNTVVSVNPGKLYHSQRLGGRYKVILAEDYSSAVAHTYYRYYSVAVVKAGRRHLKLLDLKGKKVCHGQYDYQGSTGWDIPISYLYTYHRRFKMDDRCNVLDAINRYFGASCLPDSGGSITDNMRLCAACSSGTCSREVKYWGYKGAFRCLVEDAGEVAFLTHNTVSQWTDGQSTESWTAGLKSSDYRLLCPDGSQVTVDNYNQCFIGWMRPNAVVLGQDVPAGLTTKIQNSLRNPPLRAAERIFNMDRYTQSDEDVIFSGETKELRIVEGREQDPGEYLGDTVGRSYQYSYTRAMDGLYCVTGHTRTNNLNNLLISLFYVFIILF